MFDTALTKLVFAALAAYLLGSVSFAVLISRLFANEDVRSHGSKNAGTTNMLRNYGPKLAILTFAGDFFKGAAAVWLGQWLLTGTPAMQFANAASAVWLGQVQTVDAPLVRLAAGICAIAALLGHTKPIFFGFKGGKGVATALGAISMFNFPVFLPVFIIGLAIAGISGYVSLAALVLATLFPFAAVAKMLLTQSFYLPEAIACFVIGLFVIFNHRENIIRLKNGTERSIRNKK